MNKRHLTLAGVLSLAGIVAVWDFGLLFDEHDGNTISSVMRDLPWASGAVGFTAAHLAQKSKPGTSVGLWGTAMAAVGAIGGSWLLGGGIPGLLLGGGLGYFFWKNTGES
jgi:hypothetical protein